LLHGYMAPQMSGISTLACRVSSVSRRVPTVLGVLRALGPNGAGDGTTLW
jgi:hypothetical protein